MGGPRHVPRAVLWGWAFLLPAGLGLAAAAQTVSKGGPVDSTGSEVVRAAAFGSAVALVVGLLALRSWHRRQALRLLGAPTVLVVAIAFGALLGIAATTSAPAPIAPEVTAPGTDEATITDAGSPGQGSDAAAQRDRNRSDITEVEGTIVLVVGLGLLIAAIVFLMQQSELRAARRNAVYLRSDLALEDQPQEPATDPAAIADLLGRSLAELLAESDPRMAIRAAYGTLLAELSEIGLARHRYEGPAEHIRRCLASTSLPSGAITELLRLFELARFSEHPITATHAERARRVLTESVDSLAGVRS